MAATDGAKYHSEEWLREKYIDEGLTQSEIGDLCDVTQGTIGEWIRKFDIPTGHSPDSKQYQDESWLREQYCVNTKSQLEIADECGVTQGTIYLWMEKHGIEAREMDEAVATGDLDLLKDADWLRSKYHDEGLSTLEIGEITGFNSSTVRDFMNRHGIETRIMSRACSSGDVERLWERDWLYKQYVEKDKTQQEISEELDVGLYTVQQWLKRHDIPTPESGSWCKVDDEKLNDEEWLTEQYHEQEKTAGEIAQEREVGKTTVLTRMDKFGIERRIMSGVDHHAYNTVTLECPVCGDKFEVPKGRVDVRTTCGEECFPDYISQKFSGSKHPNWKGGKPEYGEAWTTSKRQAVRIRDQARCQDCGMTESEHMDIYERKLNVHHITPARQFDNPKKRNAKSNLITLCVSCHAKWEQIAPLRPDTGVSAD